MKTYFQIKFSRAVSIVLLMTFFLVGMGGEDSFAQGTRLTFFYHDQPFSVRVETKGANATIFDAAGNKIWVCKTQDLPNLFAHVLPRELDRITLLPDSAASKSNHAEAIELYRKQLKLLPSNPYLHIGLARSLTQQGRDNEAIKSLNKALKADVNNYEALKQRGLIHFQAQRYNKSANDFTAALASVGQHLRKVEAFLGTKKVPSTRVVPGLSMLYHEDFADLATDHQSRLESRLDLLKQNLIITYSRISDQLFAANQRKAALASLEKAMKLIPHSPGLLEKYRHYSVTFPSKLPSVKGLAGEIKLWIENIATYLKDGKSSQALELLSHLKTAYPDEEQFVQLSSKIHLDSSQNNEAIARIDYLVTAFVEDSRQVDIESTLLELFAQQSQGPETATATLASLKRFVKAKTTPESEALLAAAYQQRAEQLLKSKKIQDAKNAIDHASKLSPKDPQIETLSAKIYVELAKDFSRQGQVDLSIQSYEQAVASGKGGMLVRLRLYGLKTKQYVQERIFAAVFLILLIALLAIVIKRAAQQFAEKQALRGLRRDGWRAYQKEEWSIAIDHLDQFIRRSREVIPFPIYKALAESYVNEESFDDAITIYQKIAYLFPGSNCYMDEAKLYIKLHKIPLLIAALRRSKNLHEDCKGLIDYCFERIENGADEKQHQEVIGTLYIMIGDMGRARYMFGQITARNQDQDTRYAFKKLIEITKREQDMPALLKALQRYEKRYPDDPDVHLEYGYYHEQNGNDEKALESNLRAFRASYSEAVERKVDNLRRKLSQEKIEEEMAKLQEGEQNSTTRLRLASLNYQVGRYEDAIQLARDLVKEGSCVTESLRILGLSYHYLNDYSNTIDYLKKFLREVDDPPGAERIKEARYRLAVAYQKEGLADKALREFKEIQRIDPHYRDVARHVEESEENMEGVEVGATDESAILRGTDQYAPEPESDEEIDGESDQEASDESQSNDSGDDEEEVGD